MANMRKMRWVIWVLAALFYFYEYLLRVSPSVMVPELMAVFGINAAAIGFLSAFYFFAYAPMQLPVGLLMDRFGARRLLTLASVICGLGSLFFGIANTYSLAAIGRLLIGFGSSFAFIAMVFVCTHWFESTKRALLVGLANSIGMIGAVFGQWPLSFLVEHTSWRSSMILLGIAGLGLGLLIYVLIRRANEYETETSEKAKKYSLFKTVLIFCKCPKSFLNALVTLLFYATTTAIGGLWGVPFLQATHGISKQLASFAISMLFIGWIFGGPIIGTIADKVGRKKIVILWSIFFTIASFAPVVYISGLPIWLVSILIFLTGFFSAGELLNFTLATEFHPEQIKGTAIACTNFFVAMGATLVQPAIGFILDVLANKNHNSNSIVYGAKDFQYALSLLIATLALAFILTIFINDKQVHKKEPKLDV